ncbi:hypothetical protein EMCG_03975 [[Emmonsia] crescens]|uniref:Uncharacterized protein n=1 Tax=[Emmonsia] crescens TaxID=73230 RepID=A0A0G2IZF9_9EURO|nr:hypothetical protein EMCG_03975 [Emmonsia crescens UAMH 3008]
MSTTTFSTPSQQPTSTLEPNDPITVLLTYLSSPSTSTSTTTTLESLHASLLSSLQRSGWTEQVRRLALELLRAGHCDRFEEVVDTVVALATGSEDVTASSLAVARGGKRKRRTQMMRARLKKARIGGENGEVEDGDGDGDGVGRSGDDVDTDDDADDDGNIDEDYDGNGNVDEFPDIRIPQAVVAEGVKMLHEALEGVFVLEGGGTGEPSSNTNANTTTASENDGGKDHQENQKNKTATTMTNGVANTKTNGSAAPSKKPPFSSSLKTATASADGKSTKLKSAAKGKLQENGDGKPEKKTKKG